MPGLRRTRAAAGLALLVLLAVACGTGGTTSKNSTSSQHFFIKIGSADPPGTAEALSAQSFLDEISKKSNGRLTGQLYLNSQLGTSAAMVTGVEQGTIQMNYTDVSFLSSAVPQLAALSLPFLFSCETAATSVVDGSIGNELNQDLINTAGVRVLGFHSQGSRSFDTSNKPIVNASDLKGEKFRVVPSATTLAAYKAWGAVPITLDATEIALALKQGTVDGIDQQYLTLYAYGWYQDVKYVTETNHQFVLPPFYLNEKFYESLPSDLQQIVLQAGKDSVVDQRKLADQQNATDKAKVQASGVTVEQLASGAAQDLRTAAAPAYTLASSTYGPRFMNDLIAAANKANAKCS